MKKVLVSLLLVVALSGCMSTKVQQTVDHAAKRSDKFVELMNNDRTTAEENKSFIKSVNVYHHALNYYVNGVEPPAAIKAALIEAKLWEE